jgi:hypothetical protein
MAMPLILVVLVIGIGYALYAGIIKIPTPVQGTQVPTNTPQGSCPQDPALSYIGFDNYNKGTVVSGTKYIKVDNGVPKSAYATGKYGNNLNVWLSNQTAYTCSPVTKTLGCDNAQIEVPCYANTTISLSAFDKDQNALLSNGGGATNFTMSASTPKVLYFRLTGVKDKTATPFGGVMTVEVPNHFSSVVVNSPSVRQGVGNFHDTFTVSGTGQTFVQFNFDGTLEGADGTLKEVPITLTPGSTEPTNAMYVKVCLDSASYYVDKNGNFALDVEKYNNQDTTKVSTYRECQTFYLG